MTVSPGLHHITAIASDPARNLAFYGTVLGLRLVKKTVNFDDPGTYHFYFADAVGTPGSILTFFPWPGVAPGRSGIGQAAATAFAVPERSLGTWIQRLTEAAVPFSGPQRRFGAAVLAFTDPDGLPLEIVADGSVGALPGWEGGPVAGEHAIRGFAGVTLLTGSEGTARTLTEGLGLAEIAREDTLVRYGAPGAPAIGGFVDVRLSPGFLPGRLGAGTVHHVAFRARDDAHQDALAGRLRALGLDPTPQVDRTYFRSVYLREPGGILLEIATDDPGFAVDEAPDALGQSLKLPARYESHRARIEAALPALT